MGRKKNKNTGSTVDSFLKEQGICLTVEELIPIFRSLNFKFFKEAAEIYLASGWNKKYKPEDMEEIYRERDKTLIFMPKEYKYKL